MATITELTNKYTEIDNAKKAAFAAIIEKGVAIPDGTKLDGMADLIRSIPTGGSGTSIETCEVSITFYDNMTSGSQPSYVTYTTVKDEKIVNVLITSDDADWPDGLSTGGFSYSYPLIINCVVGTSVYLADENMAGHNYVTSDNITFIGGIGNWGTICEVIINSGPIATIEVT